MDWLKFFDFFGLLDKFINSISGDLRDTIKKSLSEWESAAAKTDNPLDDLLVKLVRIILGV